MEQDTHVLDKVTELTFGQITTSPKSIDGALNQGTRDIELKAKVGDGRADATNGNNDASNNNAHGRPIMINKKNRVPYVNFFKINRITNANHKLEFVNTGDDKLCFGLCLFDLTLYLVRDFIKDIDVDYYR